MGEGIVGGWLTTGVIGFMSSLDLHTHSGFQASLKEAFAIVCAPSQSPKCVIVFFHFSTVANAMRLQCRDIPSH